MREALTFLARTLCGRAPLGVSATPFNGRCCVCLRLDSTLCGVAIIGDEYPVRVARDLVVAATGGFAEACPRHVWASPIRVTDGGKEVSWPELPKLLAEYQRPEKVDAIMKLQSDIHDLKDVMVQTIDAALRRGEHLSDLVAKSEDLSRQSKLFYAKAKVRVYMRVEKVMKITYPLSSNLYGVCCACMLGPMIPRAPTLAAW